jgi:L-seryl-tRNA(Ser) seleniumtransferase
MNELRKIPSVDWLLQTAEVRDLLQEYGAPLAVSAVRDCLDRYRVKLKKDQSAFDLSAYFGMVKEELEGISRYNLKPVINATGVILHTNLGRAVLSDEAQDRLARVSKAYSSLEYDLETGTRGSRSVHADRMLCELTGAEASLVVNNNAAAILLALTVLAKGKRVIISRGQLVEIGGGFRVPEVMKVSGAKLVEVGTTNRVRLEDYAEELQNGASVVMRAHPSNFKITGFTEQPELKALVELTHENSAYFIDDIGSGALINTVPFGLSEEPLVQESVQAGSDIVCFSGDKLLGGPQAGILVGKKELIARLKKHPLARAIRADKLCLAGLEATLRHYLKGEAVEKIPIWRMISLSAEEIRLRVTRWQQALGTGEVAAEYSTIGGGSLPGEILPTYVLVITVKQPVKALAKLRQNNPPIIGRVKDDRLFFDARTVLESEDQQLLDGIRKIT